MPLIKKEGTWSCIEESEPFIPDSLDSDEAKQHHKNAWQWLEYLEKSKRISKLDIIRLEALLDAVYELGKLRGKQEV